ncbi:MAG: hypothetical protein AAFO83_00170 [Cyanobacteria bacterium J06607_13]
MLKTQDLDGERSRMALRIIQEKRPFPETVDALASLQEDGNPVEKEEISMLLEGYRVQKQGRFVEEVEAQLDQELSEIFQTE